MFVKEGLSMHYEQSNVLLTYFPAIYPCFSKDNNNNNNNCNICQPPYSLISIKETKLEDILQVLSKAALNLKKT